MTRLTLLLALLVPLASSPAAAQADSAHCDRAALARAEAAVLEAQGRYAAATDAKDWGAQNRALVLVAATREQLRTAKALCAVAEAAQVSPFASDDDPFEPAPLMANVPDYDGDDAAFRAVMDQ